MHGLDRYRRTTLEAMAVCALGFAGACDRDHVEDRAPGNVQPTSASAKTREKIDHRNARDWQDLPAWARRTAEVHGGLGPWAIAGAIAGRDASSRLNAKHPGASIHAQHSVEPSNRRTPYTCVMDGLRVGAGLDEAEVQFVFLPERERGDPAPEHGEKPTTMFFVAYDSTKRPLEVLRYTPTSDLLRVLHEGSMDGLAADARRLIPKSPDELFTIESIDSGQWQPAAASASALGECETVPQGQAGVP